MSKQYSEDQPRPFVGSAGFGVSNYTLHQESAFNTTRGEIPYMIPNFCKPLCPVHWLIYTIKMEWKERIDLRKSWFCLWLLSLFFFLKDSSVPFSGSFLIHSMQPMWRFSGDINMIYEKIWKALEKWCTWWKPTYYKIQMERNGEEGDFSLEFSHFMGQAVWAVYQIIVVRFSPISLCCPHQYFDKYIYNISYS